MEIVRALPDTPHDQCGIVLLRSTHGTRRFGVGRRGGGSRHLRGALLTQLCEGGFEFLPQGLLPLLALDEPLALSERERVIPALLLQGGGTAGTLPELLLHLAVPLLCICGPAVDGLALIIGVLGFVLLLAGVRVLTVDDIDGGQVVYPSVGTEHVLILASKVILHLRLREIGVQVLRHLHRRIPQVGLLRMEHIDEEVTRGQQERVQDSRKDVLRLLEVNLDLFHLHSFGLVSWYVRCPALHGASGRLPARRPSAPGEPCTPA